MKLLLLGGAGQVGHELLRALAPLGELTVTTRDGRLAGAACEMLDLTDVASIAPLIERIAPDAVVNAAAYTAVDRAEDEPELAFRINAEAPRALADACAAQGAALLHYSTDYVFDGAGRSPYRPGDAAAPAGVYGASKLAGEQAITGSGARHLTRRPAWGYGLQGHTFLGTMLRLGAGRDELRVVDDQFGSPTPAWLVADATAAILGRGIAASGVQHLVTGGHTSWHGFAQAIFDEALARGLIGRRPRVVPIPTSAYPTRASRPAWSVLDASQLAAEYGLVLPGWREALRRTFDDRPAG